MILTVAQEEAITLKVSKKFSKTITDDYFHFSLERVKLNRDTMRFVAYYEVHSEVGSFNVSVDINDQNKAIMKTFKAVKF